MLALTALAVLLIADPRLRQRPLVAGGRKVVAVVLTPIPNLMFHATILYLELPIVLALAIVLWDGRRWLEEPYPRSLREMVVVGYYYHRPVEKETSALPILSDPARPCDW